MRRRNLHVLIAGAMVANVIMVSALAFSGCTSYAADCHHTLTCQEPAYCFDAGDAQLDGCQGFNTGGEESDAQVD
jgi:hypothetical protein